MTTATKNQTYKYTHRFRNGRRKTFDLTEEIVKQVSESIAQIWLDNARDMEQHWTDGMTPDEILADALETTHHRIKINQADAAKGGYLIVDTTFEDVLRQNNIIKE